MGVTACNVAKVIMYEGNGKNGLIQREDGQCYNHVASKKEVNIPQNFESLTPNQKKQSVTYVYKNTASWEIGITLNDKKEHRYILFKSSKVLACDYDDKTNDGSWKN